MANILSLYPRAASVAIVFATNHHVLNVLVPSSPKKTRLHPDARTGEIYLAGIFLGSEETGRGHRGPSILSK